MPPDKVFEITEVEPDPSQAANTANIARLSAAFASIWDYDHLLALRLSPSIVWRSRLVPNRN